MNARFGFQSVPTCHGGVSWRQGAVWVQVDTFEAVKNNVYGVLGDLAKDLHGSELDLLFSKFEACTGWPAPDTLKAMDLLRRLAHSDDKARAPIIALDGLSGRTIQGLPLVA